MRSLRGRRRGQVGEGQVAAARAPLREGPHSELGSRL